MEKQEKLEKLLDEKARKLFQKDYEAYYLEGYTGGTGFIPMSKSDKEKAIQEIRKALIYTLKKSMPKNPLPFFQNRYSIAMRVLNGINDISQLQVEPKDSQSKSKEEPFMIKEEKKPAMSRKEKFKALLDEKAKDLLAHGNKFNRMTPGMQEESMKEIKAALIYTIQSRMQNSGFFHSKYSMAVSTLNGINSIGQLKFEPKYPKSKPEEQNPKNQGRTNEETYYAYRIEDITLDEKKGNLLVNYGKPNTPPLSISKTDIMDFISAIMPEAEMKYRKLTPETIYKSLEENGTKLLNMFFKGRSMILISDFRDYLDYYNGAQKGVKQITSLNIDGEIEREHAFNYAKGKNTQLNNDPKSSESKPEEQNPQKQGHTNKGDSYYIYGIETITENSDNKDLLNVEYGPHKLPISIFKKDIMDFIRAILPEQEIDERRITSELISKSLEKNGTALLNEILAGRSMILISDYKNYLEYYNGVQNSLMKITGLHMDGHIQEKNAFNYILREPSREDLRPPRSPKESQQSRGDSER